MPFLLRAPSAFADEAAHRFLYGFPPFHDETPEKVFENILSRKIEWHEDEVDISPEAHDFMERLLCSDSTRRLGANGTEEVKAHPFLASIEWDNLLTGEVDFVPKISDPESTEYFDPRGAVQQVFEEAIDESADTVLASPQHIHTASEPVPPPESTRRPLRERSETEPSPHEDFGTFNFRNLPVLKQANDEVIRQMRSEQMKIATTPSPEVTSPRLPKTKARAASLEFGVSSAPFLIRVLRLTMMTRSIRRRSSLLRSARQDQDQGAARAKRRSISNPISLVRWNRCHSLSLESDEKASVSERLRQVILEGILSRRD